jgi:hypothetical protein
MKCCKKWLDTCVFFLKRWQSVTDPNRSARFWDTGHTLVWLGWRSAIARGAYVLVRNALRMTIARFRLHTK